MTKRVCVYWPGDGRAKPNELAIPNIEAATVQLEAALKKLGRTPYRIEGFIDKPHHAINRLGPVDDPIVGVFVHWVYGPNTTEGVVGKDNPLLLASNFSGQWPGLVGLLNTGACLESLGRAHSRIWTDAPDWTKDATFMERLDEWLSSGAIAYPTDGLLRSAAISADARERALRVAAGIKKRRAFDHDAGRHLHGHDQRLLRPAAARPARLFRAQDRPGMDHRPRPRRQRQTHRGCAGVREGARPRIPLG